MKKDKLDELRMKMRNIQSGLPPLSKHQPAKPENIRTALQSAAKEAGAVGTAMDFAVQMVNVQLDVLQQKMLIPPQYLPPTGEYSNLNTLVLPPAGSAICYSGWQPVQQATDKLAALMQMPKSKGLTGNAKTSFEAFIKNTGFAVTPQVIYRFSLAHSERKAASGDNIYHTPEYVEEIAQIFISIPLDKAKVFAASRGEGKSQLAP